MNRTASALLVFAILASGCATAAPPPAPEKPRPEGRVTYQAQQADFMTILEEIVRQGRLNVILNKGVKETSGKATVCFTDASARDAVVVLAKTFDLQVTDETGGLIRISKP